MRDAAHAVGKNTHDITALHGVPFGLIVPVVADDERTVDVGRLKPRAPYRKTFFACDDFFYEHVVFFSAPQF